MKTLNCCVPRQSVLDGSEDFVVNISALAELTEKEAAEFLDSNVLTSGMEELIMQSFDRLPAWADPPTAHSNPSPGRRKPPRMSRYLAIDYWLSGASSAVKTTIPINTPLQRGAGLKGRKPNRFNGLQNNAAPPAKLISSLFTNPLTNGIN
jgi:hypothetical protein